MKFVKVGACAVLVACAPVEEELVEVEEEVVIEEPAPPLLEECDAADYRRLIGTPVVEAGLIGGDRLQIFSVNAIVTQDYVPQRTNVVYDADGVISQVYCG